MLIFIFFVLQDNVFMHLTNYAINKHSEDFIRDDEAGSKRYSGKKSVFECQNFSWSLSYSFNTCKLEN